MTACISKTSVARLPAVCAAGLWSLFALFGFEAADKVPEIPKGAHLLLRLENSVTTRTARPGDHVYFRTASPLASGGRILVHPGSFVQGVVASAKRSGRARGRAELAIRIETLTTPSGQVFRFEPRLGAVEDDGAGQRVGPETGVIRRDASIGKDAGQVAIFAGGGAWLGATADRSWQGAGIGAGAGAAVGLATAILTRGREIELRRGSTIEVVFDRPLRLE